MGYRSDAFDIVVAKLRIDGVEVVNWFKADEAFISNTLTLHTREGADMEILGYYPNMTSAQAGMAFIRYRQAEGK
jgi:hypothetical protein